MRFTKDIFESVLRGAHSVFEDEQGRLHTVRFTDTQKEVISKRCPNNVWQQPGMRLDFYTDAEGIRMAFDYTHFTSRIFMSVDIYEDGVMTYSYVEKNAFDAHAGGFDFKLEKKGRHRVTVFLPFSLELVFTNIELYGESFIEPYSDYSAFVYMIGDSITHGADCEKTSQSYANVALRRLDLDVINQGVGGYVFCADSLDPTLFEGKKQPDAITVAYGTNDWSSKEKEAFCRDVDEFFVRLREIYPSIPVLVITPVFRAAHYVVTKAGTFEAAREYIAESAKKHENVFVLDGDKLVPHIYDYFRDVRLHPNDAGFATYGQGVADALSEILGIRPHVYFI